MSQVFAESMQCGYRFQSKAALTAVRYDTRVLAVQLTSPGDGVIASLEFEDVVGFRLLDEGNLLEFWPNCSSAHGWLFRIERGGWFDQELTRKGFLHDKSTGICEYFVASQNDCINVLAGTPPRLKIDAI